MKKILSFLFILVAFSSFAQDKISTTVNEYNYLVKGYAQDVDAGRSVKDGYKIENFYTFKNGSFTHEYLYLYSIESETPKAVLMINTKTRNAKKVYLCLPFNNKDLFKLFVKDYEALGISMGISANVATYDLLSNVMPVIYNIANNNNVVK